MSGSWGVGLVAFDRLFEMLPALIFAALFLGALGLIAWVRS